MGLHKRQPLPPFRTLLAVLCVCEPRRTVRLESVGSSWKLALHIALGPLNVVSENMKSRPIALRLNCHWFLRLWSHRVTHVQYVQEGFTGLCWLAGERPRDSLHSARKLLLIVDSWQDSPARVVIHFETPNV